MINEESNLFAECTYCGKQLDITEKEYYTRIEKYYCPHCKRMLIRDSNGVWEDYENENKDEEVFIQAFDCLLKDLETKIKNYVLENNLELNRIRTYSNIGYNNNELYAVADLYLI